MFYNIHCDKPYRRLYNNRFLFVTIDISLPLPVTGYCVIIFTPVRR